MERIHLSAASACFIVVAPSTADHRIIVLDVMVPNIEAVTSHIHPVKHSIHHSIRMRRRAARCARLGHHNINEWLLAPVIRNLIHEGCVDFPVVASDVAVLLYLDAADHNHNELQDQIDD